MPISMKEMVGGCCVCSDERGWAENPLVYCDGQGCNVAVHQACYGIVQVPTGPWFCRKCESQERAARVKCELCQQKDGALKRTDSGGWCHVVCALFIPEAWFANVQTMEPIVLKNLPQERFNKICYVCEEKDRASKASTGACMQCNKNGCKQYFHVTCAQAQGLLCEEAGNYGDNVKYCGYCDYHYKKLKKDANIKIIPPFKPIPADNATPDSTPEKTFPSNFDKMKPKQNKAEAKGSEYNTQTVRPFLSNFPSPSATNNEKARQPVTTPPLSNTSSGIGTDSSAVSPTESPSQDDAEWRDRNSEDHLINVVDNSSNCSPNSGKTEKLFSADSNFLSGGPDLSNSALPPQNNVFTGNLEKFLASTKQAEPPPEEDSDTETEDLDPGIPKRPRSRSLDKNSKKCKRTKPAVIKKKLGANSPPLSKKNKSKPETTQASSFSVFGGSPVFPTLGTSGSLQLSSFVKTAPSSNLNLTCPPKVFPSVASSTSTEVNQTSEFPATMEQLLERQWEQGSQFLMQQGQHFDIASLLNCLHQLKNENHRLEDHVKSLTARRDHLLAVNARLSVPFSANTTEQGPAKTKEEVVLPSASTVSSTTMLSSTSTTGTTLPSSSSNLISFKPHQTASKTTDSSHNISGQNKMDDT